MPDIRVLLTDPEWRNKPLDERLADMRQYSEVFKEIGGDLATEKAQLDLWERKIPFNAPTRFSSRGDAAGAPGAPTGDVAPGTPTTSNWFEAFTSGQNRGAVSAVGEPIANVMGWIGAKRPEAAMRNVNAYLNASPQPEGAAVIPYMAGRAPGFILPAATAMIPGVGGPIAAGALAAAQQKNPIDAAIYGGLSALGVKGAQKFLPKLMAPLLRRAMGRTGAVPPVATPTAQPTVDPNAITQELPVPTAPPAPAERIMLTPEQIKIARGILPLDNLEKKLAKTLGADSDMVTAIKGYKQYMQDIFMQRGGGTVSPGSIGRDMGPITSGYSTQATKPSDIFVNDVRKVLGVPKATWDGLTPDVQDMAINKYMTIIMKRITPRKPN